MSSQRPVYIPRKRRAPGNNNTTDAAASTKMGNDYQTRRQIQKQQQPRFHGAFTGGFSAGYFNTVGTKEGWKPSQVKKRDQKLEDFMDDEDHANWGGPTRLRDDYNSKTSAPTESPTDDMTSATKRDSRTPFLPVKSMLEISHQTVGPRLLRRLGWREGGSAIVPVNTATNSAGDELKQNDNTLENLAKVHLSRRKLRKIQLQSSRVSLPPPKLDQCGLGFEPYKDAPEFQRYREKRKQQARDRASYNSRDNVYRVSDVAKAEDNDNSNRATSSRHPQENNSGEYLSYETAEDFVGKRSAAGFALRDDEDNAYDDDHTTYDRQNGKYNGGPQSALKKGFSVGDEYNTEVYEHESSDEDDYGRGGVLPNASSVTSTKTKRKESVDIGSMFAAFAGTDQPGGKSSSVQRATLTSDGKPPLAGFILGDSMDINKRRYPGPDMPRDYTIQRHKFGEHENPYVLEAISNAVRLEQKEERRSQLRQPQSQPQIQQKLEESSRPLSNNFSALAEAMKSRFTSSTEEASKKGESVTETSNSLPAGLHMPIPVENKEDNFNNGNLSRSRIDTPKVTITRTVASFFPNPLVCKRFRVPIPTNARRGSSLLSGDEKKNESAYFEKEILGKAKQQQKKEKKVVQDIDDARKQILESQEEETPKGIDRPSIENLRKIFQASSDESSSSDDDGSDEDSKVSVDRPIKDSSGNTKDDSSHRRVRRDDTPKEAPGFESRELVEYRPSSSKNDGVDSVSSSRGSDSDDDESSRARSRKRKKSKHRRKHSSHHRKKHKRKRYYSSDGSSSRDDDDEGRREDRRSREHKRRKKKKSSRHKSRKREKVDKR